MTLTRPATVIQLGSWAAWSLGGRCALTTLPPLARQSRGAGSGDLDLVRPFQAREAGMIAADLGRTACDDRASA